MKKIGNNFSIIGTNPKKYFENYCLYINNHSVGAIFEVDKNFNVIFNDEIVFEGKSGSTLRQNIDLWEAFGFVLRLNNHQFLKVVEYSTNNKLFEYAKGALLQEHVKESINRHRNTILLKLLQISQPNFVFENNLYARNSLVSFEQLKKEIGEFERLLEDDKTFMNVVNMMWGKHDE